MLAIGGFTPLSTIDYPDKLSAVIYCQGCPMNCSFCHNKELIDMKMDSKIKWHSLMDFLHRRVGLLDAVVFSGGEPLAQKNLCNAIKEIKKLGFLVGVHTSGYSFKRFAKVLPLIDWVNIDIKASYDNYERNVWKCVAKLSTMKGQQYNLTTIRHNNIVESNLDRALKTMLVKDHHKYVEMRDVNAAKNR